VVEKNLTSKETQKALMQDPVLKMDFSSESFGGGTNAAAALGNGRLSVGISPWAEVVYFRWPTLSHYDHLRYFTRTFGLLGTVFPRDMRRGEEAAFEWQRYGRPLEAYPMMGAKRLFRFPDGASTWMGDPSWASTREYRPPDGPVLETRLTHPQVAAAARQWVDWQQDLLVQDFQVESGEAGQLVYYASYAPSHKIDHYYGMSKTSNAGYATFFVPEIEQLLYLGPNVVTKERTASLQHGAATPEQVDQTFPEGGTFIAMSLMGDIKGFQVGAGEQGRARPAKAPHGASEEGQHGHLGGNLSYFGAADAGFEVALAGVQENVTVLTAVASSAQAATAIIADARQAGLESLEARVSADWQDITRQIDLPSEAEDGEVRVARRALMNLFIGRNRATGAIVASPSRQPQYHFDWPRDGAFFDLALDLAGFHDIVTSHLSFYRNAQRRSPLGASALWVLGLRSPIYIPRGHWYPHHYVDGKPGELRVIPFEIDETALMLWDLWRHEQFVPDNDRTQYAQEFLPMLQLAADAACRYVDVKKEWTRRAHEDDNPVPSATLHGAAAILAGLAAAADAGARWGADAKSVGKWQGTAAALRQGMLRRIEDERTLKRGGWRGIQWSLFPAPLFEHLGDPRAGKLIDRLAQEIQEKVTRQRRGFAYLGEQAFILALAAAGAGRDMSLAKDAISLLTGEVPISGSDCYGEVTLWVDLPGQSAPVAQQRTSIPHLWTGITTYLAVEAYYRPDRFTSQIPPIPE
jgi:hypothetical protein